MKNIYKSILFVFIAAGVFTSCDKELNQVPFDELSIENAFLTPADFEAGINGVYSSLTRGSYYGGSFLANPDVLSDNVTLSTFGCGTKSTIHNWQYDVTNGYRGLYQDVFVVIYRANIILENLAGFEGDNKDNITGQAMALRALAHFDAARVFSQIPTQSGNANASLSIPLKLSSDPNEQLAQVTVGEMYDFITSELETAKALVDATPTATGQLDKEAISLILSRAYLYMGRWQDAINSANEVTTAVAARDNVVGVWEDTSTSGLIFYIPNAVETTNSNVGVQWSQGSPASLIPEYVASFELDQLYDEGNDIRKEAYIIDSSVSAGDPVNGIKKLLGKDGGFNGVVDIKILRAAEAFLNKAEAHFELGQTGPALTALNAVRSNRYTTAPSGETGNALRDAIRLERRLEFAFESQRFFDLKRWNLAINRANFGDLANGTGAPSQILTLDQGSFKFLLPYDSSTIILNPMIQQNPGY
jgi:hypothetical protein